MTKPRISCVVNNQPDQHFDEIVTELIKAFHRMKEDDLPILAKKAQIYSTAPIEHLEKKMMEVFTSAITSDFKAKFDSFLQEKHKEFIKCFPMLDSQLERLCHVLETLHIERYSLEKTAQDILNCWIQVQ